jgi:hypothetical protein
MNSPSEAPKTQFRGLAFLKHPPVRRNTLIKIGLIINSIE